MPRRPNQAPRARTALPLTGTVHKHVALLDADSVLAIEYAQQWQRRHGSLKVPAGGIVRRALHLYVKHLAAAEGRTEVRSTAQACKAFTRPSTEHQLTLLRLHAVPDEEPLPAFEVVRDGARAVAERAASHQRIEQLLEQLP
jgi:hypothetical protein